MSNLLNDDEGRSLLTYAQWWLLERRMARFFKTHLVTDVDRWSHGTQEFDLGVMLGELNVANDDGLRDLYRLLGYHGGLRESISDLTFTVDSVNGSDITGTGSADRPFASLWFLKFLPKRINHKYRILIVEDLDESSNRIDIKCDFGPNGCLSFVGVGAEEILAGASGSINGAPINQRDALWEATVAIGVPIAEHEKYYIQNTNAGSDDYHFCTPIVKQSTGNLKYWFRIDSMEHISDGDTYNIIRPSRVLKIDTMSITSKSDNTWKTHETQATYAEGHVVFCNLRIEVGESTANNKEKKFIVDGDVQIVFGFVDFKTFWSGYRTIIFKDTDVNQTTPVDDGLQALTQTTVENMFPIDIVSPLLYKPNSCGFHLWMDPNPVNQYFVQFINSNIACFDNASVNQFIGKCNAICCTCSIISIWHSEVSFDKCAVDPRSDVVNGIHMQQSRVSLGNFLWGQCQYATKCVMSDLYLSGDFGGDNTAGTYTSFIDYVIEIEAQTRVYMNAAWSGQGSPVAQQDVVSFDPGGPWVSPFPAAGAIVPALATYTAALGSHCSRVI